MIIRELRLKNFGKFQNKTIELKEGINLIYGENESGKSTVHAFIQGIFFGIRRMRGRASKTDDYTKYIPWNNPGWYEGMVRFTCGEKQFRLERSFLKNEDRTELVCESDGELLSIKDGDLEMLLGNISESVYENTVSVGQMKSRTEDSLAGELRNYLSNYQGSGDGFLDVTEALAYLKSQKKALEKKVQERKLSKERVERELQMKMDYLRKDMEEIKGKAENMCRQIEEASNCGKNTDIESYRASGDKRIPAAAGVLAAIVLLVKFIFPDFGGVFFNMIAVLGVIGILGAGVFLFRKPAKSSTEREEDNSKTKELDRLRAQRQLLMAQYREKHTELSNLKEEYEELLQAEEDKEAGEIKAVELAAGTIQRLAANMQNTVEYTLKAQISQILASMTEGRYGDVSIDDSLHLALHTSERYVPLFQVSRGTIEQVYLALRMAVGNILCSEEPMPVILDETFAMYDDKRLLEALKWLEREKEQVILFSCNTREKTLLEREGIPCHFIEL